MEAIFVSAVVWHQSAELLSAIQLILPADTRLPTRRCSPATPKKTRRRAA